MNTLLIDDLYPNKLYSLLQSRYKISIIHCPIEGFIITMKSNDSRVRFKYLVKVINHNLLLALEEVYIKWQVIGTEENPIIIKENSK